MTLTYYYGRLLRDNARTSNKHKQARYLIISEVVAVGYSWFFSWRQLRIVIQPIEPVEYDWIAVVSAAFIPLLLAFIGWAQSLIVTPPDADGKPVDTKAVTSEHRMETTGQPVAAIPAPVVASGKPPAATKTIDAPLWRSLVAKMDGDAPMDAGAVNRWLADHGYEQKAVTTPAGGHHCEGGA